MVNSVEPGIYVPGVGGFRHSDVMLVTEDGATCLTEFPRDL
jgi:Xaa-Pro aminopeptidase